jgi:hypothetical protein
MRFTISDLRLQSAGTTRQIDLAKDTYGPSVSKNGFNIGRGFLEENRRLGRAACCAHHRTDTRRNAGHCSVACVVDSMPHEISATPTQTNVDRSLRRAIALVIAVHALHLVRCPERWQLG